MSSTFLFVILLICLSVVQCSFQSELFSVLKQVKLVTPSEAGLKNFVSQVEDTILKYDLNQLLGNSTLAFILEGEVREILKKNGYPIVVQVPSPAMFPIIQSEIERILVDLVRGADVDLKGNRVSVSVPSSGKCSNTVKVDIKVDAEKKLCTGFFGWMCPSVKGRLTAHGCFKFVTSGWTIQTQIIDKYVHFDGTNFFTELIDHFVDAEINDKVQDAIQNGISDIDVGKTVDEEIEKEVNVAIDDLIEQFSSFVPAGEIDQMVEQVKKYILRVINTNQFSNIEISITPDFVSFSLAF
eukprot:TRINITY_DN817_c0_g1_i10.p1 TRINITY_DN817_c0_g1~~TRINITY_DN817_c0_g1_i10.p1  ORF type:complete len:297 (-),score=46.28 TRINITY_DN817_c0_g1_i10:364-1254(-)